MKMPARAHKDREPYKVLGGGQEYSVDSFL